MRAWPVTLILLAGCASVEPALECHDCTVEVAPPSDRTATIKGVIVDETITPILANVTIRIGLEIIAELESGEEGFQVKGLDPGTYILSARAPGHESVEVFVDVAPGETLPARIMLPSIPPPVQFSITWKWDGMLGCSGDLVVTYFQLCSVVRPWTGDDCCDHYAERLQEVGRIDHLQSELVWDSNQAFGESLRLTGYAEGGTTHAMGTSPLALVFPEEAARDHRFGEGGHLSLQVWAKADDLPVGLVIQQPFEAFTTVFVGTAPADGWMLVTHGEPNP